VANKWNKNSPGKSAAPCVKKHWSLRWHSSLTSRTDCNGYSMKFAMRLPCVIAKNYIQFYISHWKWFGSFINCDSRITGLGDQNGELTAASAINWGVQLFNGTVKLTLSNWINIQLFKLSGLYIPSHITKSIFQIYCECYLVCYSYTILNILVGQLLTLSLECSILPSNLQITTKQNYNFVCSFIRMGGTRSSSRLGYFATRWKVSGLIPDGVTEFFQFT
jgi:hypothetical protein